MYRGVLKQTSVTSKQLLMFAFAVCTEANSSNCLLFK